MKKTICALTILSAVSLPAMAAVDVIVTGTITPAACTLNLPGLKTIDYGKISPTLLDATNYTKLGEQQIDIALKCDALAKMGLKVVNKRPNTMAGVTEGVSGAGRAPVSLFGVTSTDGAGLGEADSKKIGGYGVRLVPGSIQVDANSVDVISKGAGETAWVKNDTGSMYLATKERHVSWATTKTVVPVAFEEMTAKLGVEAYINKKSELDLSKDITLDGLTTIELVYL